MFPMAGYDLWLRHYRGGKAWIVKNIGDKNMGLLWVMTQAAGDGLVAVTAALVVGDYGERRERESVCGLGIRLSGGNTNV